LSGAASASWPRRIGRPIDHRASATICFVARRQEDPDTLFFSRRLAMEGDTELGLLVKNTIDAIELPVLDLESLKPSQVLARMRHRLAPR
jgi:predicted lipid carrier protein YhbT